MSRSRCPPAPAATPSSGLRLCALDAAGRAGYRGLRGLLGHGSRVRALARGRNLACRKNRQLPDREENHASAEKEC